MSVTADQLLQDLRILRNNPAGLKRLLSEDVQPPPQVNLEGFQPAVASMVESVQLSLQYTQTMRNQGTKLKDDHTVDSMGQRIDQVRERAEEMDKSLKRIR